MASFKVLAALAIVTKAAGAASTSNGSLAITSWGAPRLDVFGVAPDNTIWHKYEAGTGFGWEPGNGLFENMNATAFENPVATSWGNNRLDHVHIGRKSAAFHKYWDGFQWARIPFVRRYAGSTPGEYSERLEGEFSSGLAVNSWGVDRFDIVGRSTNMTFLHKAWTGTDYYPAVDKWEDLGGNFSSGPATVSWGPGRLDILGVSAESGSMLHKF
ncbi:hypothetical protein LTS18_005524 [Coniosporium uncinatum]|uniref:Uncharacterized protein n=1 Tax=Coniosporium uncinatum TaxID=93489 RepID=A0ACC3D512_9PEZI|nr:hypothetical protein LTS18_005524 [Coniosporium uncinatum]